MPEASKTVPVLQLDTAAAARDLSPVERTTAACAIQPAVRIRKLRGHRE
jgi:hypothetical protein